MNHPIPDEALETDIATLAMKGAGKSYLNKGLVERLLHKNRRVIVLDPLGHWWSLKAKADGTPGFPIAVLGGDHADVLITADDGERLGAFLGRGSMSAVVDVSGMKRGDLIRFATAFCDALYEHNREALWLLLEEADIFAPQNPSADGTRAMGDTIDMIARRGRQRGFRLWTLTQRPARLNKDVINMAATLVTLRTMGPLDRKAAEGWFLAHTDRKTARETGATFAGLDIGEGWIFSPSLNILKRAHFPRIETLDTSSTPKAGEARPKDINLSKVELGELKALLTKRKRVATAPTGPSGYDDDDVLPNAQAEKEAAVQEAYKAGVEDGRRLGMSAALTKIYAAVGAIAEEMGEPVPRASSGAPLSDGHVQAQTSGTAQLRVPEPPAPAPITVELMPEKRPRPPQSIEGPLTGAALKLAQALARYPVGLNWLEICVVAGMITGNGYFYGGRKNLIERGLIDDSSGTVTATAECIKMAGGAEKMLTRKNFKEIWGGRKQPGPRMFSFICDAAGEWISMQGLAKAVEIKPGNGFWYGGLSSLRDANLIVQEKDRVRVIDLIGKAAP